MNMTRSTLKWLPAMTLTIFASRGLIGAGPADSTGPNAAIPDAQVPDRFQGVTYDGPHEFNAQMQGQAFAWLDRWLKP